MEIPMDDITNIDINPMSSIPCKTIQCLFSMDEIIEDIDKSTVFHRVWRDKM